MKTYRTYALLGVLSLLVLNTFSCKKSDLTSSKAPVPADELQSKNVYQNAIVLSNGSLLAGGVTLEHPAQVNINEQFKINADIDCGRVAIEQGYILAANGITKIYTGIDCETENLQWEDLTGFDCYTGDAGWSGAFQETGIFLFRTKHNAADGNCDSKGGSDKTGECSFNGNQFYCFTIEAINSCQTSFTGTANSCSNARQAVYHFTSVNDLSYIKIQGGLTNFTGDDADVTITGGNLTWSQSTPGGSSNRVIKIEGSVTACQPVTITISWNSTNTGGIITGSWSVKDDNGNEVAPSIAGLTCN